MIDRKKELIGHHFKTVSPYYRIQMLGRTCQIHLFDMEIVNVLVLINSNVTLNSQNKIGKKKSNNSKEK